LTASETPLDSRSNLVAWRRQLLSTGKQGTPVRFRDGPAAVSRRSQPVDRRNWEQAGCYRAIASTSALRPCSREGVSRSSLGVRRPTSVREHANLRGRSGRHGRGGRCSLPGRFIETNGSFPAIACNTAVSACPHTPDRRMVPMLFRRDRAAWNHAAWNRAAWKRVRGK
jgi:hypothetical protein